MYCLPIKAFVCEVFSEPVLFLPPLIKSKNSRMDQLSPSMGPHSPYSVRFAVASTGSMPLVHTSLLDRHLIWFVLARAPRRRSGPAQASREPACLPLSDPPTCHRHGMRERHHRDPPACEDHRAQANTAAIRDKKEGRWRRWTRKRWLLGRGRSMCVAELLSYRVAACPDPVEGRGEGAKGGGEVPSGKAGWGRARGGGGGVSR